MRSVQIEEGVGQRNEPGPLEVDLGWSPRPIEHRERPRHRASSLLVWGPVWLGLSAFLGYVGRFAVLSYFGPYDDEGYWLIALRSYHLHGSLYNKTYSQAGPVYYEVWSALYSLMRVPVNWDSGRYLTLGVWVATSLLVGVAMWLLTRSMLLGLLAEVVSYLVMFLLSGVSMEPAGLAHFFAAAALLGVVLYLRGYGRTGMAVLGMACVATTLVKVNVGAFVVLGVCAAIALYWPVGGRFAMPRRFITYAILIAFPVVVTESVLNRSWVLHYCLLEIVYLISVIAALASKRPINGLRVKDIWVGLYAAIGTALLATLGVLINGTSLGQLIYGAFLSQRGLAKAIQVSPSVRKIVGLTLLPSAGEVAVAIISTAVALVICLHFVRMRQARPAWIDSRMSGFVRVLVGLWILLTITQGFDAWTPSGLVVAPWFALPVPGQTFLLAAPFIWVAALGVGPESDEVSFGRAAICLVGVLGCLEGFPVAGSQVLWASLGLVPVGIICIADGLRLMSWAGSGVSNPSSRAARRTMSVVLAATLAALTVGNTGKALARWRDYYDSNKPLALPGASSVRLPVAEDVGLRQVTAFLKARCSTYWSVPGLDSFYFFTGQTPPTGFNVSQGWWADLSLDQQNQVLQTLRHTNRLCIVEDNQFVNHTFLGVRVRPTPLLHFIETNFSVVQVFPGYPAWSYQVLVANSDLSQTE
jgi:hypothetical protein